MNLELRLIETIIGWSFNKTMLLITYQTTKTLYEVRKNTLWSENYRLMKAE